jgi:hypothetical protein
MAAAQAATSPTQPYAEPSTSKARPTPKITSAHVAPCTQNVLICSMEIKNDGRLKICWMRIVGYQQFQDVFLDFTHPETGKPLDKICLIGANGTGKTKVLLLLGEVIARLNPDTEYPLRINFNGLALIKFSLGGYNFLFWRFGGEFGYSKDFPEIEILIEDYRSKGAMNGVIGTLHALSQIEVIQIHNLLHGYTMVAACVVDGIPGKSFEMSDLEQTNLDQALNTPQVTEPHTIISPFSVVDFWHALTRQLYARQRKQIAYFNNPENGNVTLNEIKKEFESLNPSILHPLQHAWNQILSKAFLEFDIEKVKVPIDPLDNLEAYITLTTNGLMIPYDELSTGIRNFLFRIGQIQTTFFDSGTRHSFLLVDEPENGLFPDFLYDLVDVYRQVTTDKNGENNTQMFFATHEPIIAAQFEPYERIILEWNDDGTVHASRGVAPIGDDPNDLLTQDFEVRNLMGKAGLKKWEEYLDLRNQLIHSNDDTEKERLLTQILMIGKQYHFGPNEVPSKIR